MEEVYRIYRVLGMEEVKTSYKGSKLLLNKIVWCLRKSKHIKYVVRIEE